MPISHKIQIVIASVMFALSTTTFVAGVIDLHSDDSCIVATNDLACLIK